MEEKEVTFADTKTNKSTTKESYVLRLRACLSCRIILSDQQFYEGGCPNCTHLTMEYDRQKVNSCTTMSFKGMISMLKADESWVARYNKLTNVIPGCYAVSVSGDLMSEDEGNYNGDY
ncbi:transcription elongation factor SPT4 [Cryptosporidium felis]|nr:transcription elongation factor SPT4 [Cryptosporidium felis]